MKRFHNALAAAALAGTAGLLTFDPAAAQSANRVRAGVLSCDISGGLGMILGSQKQVTCMFAPSRGGPREVYVGTISKFGLDIGAAAGGRMEWAVYAPTTRRLGALAGRYTGAGAQATVGVGEWPVRVQAILPEAMTIKAGDSIKWVNRAPGEPHTVTFIGAGETPPEDTLVEAFADGSPKFVQNMLTFLPQGGNVFSGTGYVNSGFMGIPELGLPMEWECTFDTPGEYIPYCILHGDSEGNNMAARLTVSPA